MFGVNGIKSVARMKAAEEAERYVIESAHDSSKVADMFLDDSNDYTHDDAYDDEKSDDILNSEEAKKIDKFIESIPEATDEDDDVLINAILDAKDDESIFELENGGDKDGEEC